MAPSTTVVELQHVTKRYGAVVACDRVDLTLRAGQVHGVLGENGAGKSTLMKVLIGLVQPDEGRVLLDGVPRRIPDPQTAAALGIGMVHQHFSLVEPLTVWENVVLGDDERLDRRRARDLVAEIGEYYGLALDPDARVADLSAGNRQRVELLKCLRRKPRVVVLDEPTSVLTPQESEGLFAAMRDIVARDLQAAVLVSHKLAEVLHATDVVTIMRHGRVVDHHPTAGATAASLARSMVGRSVSLRDEAAAARRHRHRRGGRHRDGRRGRGHVRPRRAAHHRRDACTATASRVLDGLDLDVRAGEIVGVAGVEGNGQRELGDLLSSLITLDRGRVEVAGRAVRTGRAGSMARAGVAVIPEDRHDSGCALDMSVAENLVVDRARLGVPPRHDRPGRAAASGDRADGGVRHQGGEPVGADAHPVRREPATRRARPRAEPPAGRSRRRPADAGPRRRRHRVHVDAGCGRPPPTGSACC